MSELPDPPWRVFARLNSPGATDWPGWFIWEQHEQEFVEVDHIFDWSPTPPFQLDVIPHPLNDLVAVAIIEAAKKGVKDA